MRNSKILLVLVLALSLSGLVVASSHGDVFYVDTNHPNANDSNTGTEVEPWKQGKKRIMLVATPEYQKISVFRG